METPNDLPPLSPDSSGNSMIQFPSSAGNLTASDKINSVSQVYKSVFIDSKLTRISHSSRIISDSYSIENI